MNTLKTIIATVAVTTVAGIAYAQMNHGSHGSGGMMKMEDMQGMMQMMMPADGDSESTKAYKHADMDMMHGMSVAYTHNPDVDFRLKMIPHHQGAIDMAKVALQHATDPSTKAMAEAIIAAQEKEIAEMQAWLDKNGK
jgi:uncharacterized protein (DUF305 family)